MLLRLCTALLICLPVAAQAKWLRAETASFVGYSRGSEKALRAALRELQDFDALLRLLTRVDVAPAVRLPVYFVSGADFAAMGVTGRDIGGFYVADDGFVGAFVATDRARGNYTNGVNTVLFHEYTHHFMYQYTRGAYPPWYVEGFAEYLSTAKFGDGFTDVGAHDFGRGYVLMNEAWLPMQRIFTGKVEGLSPVDGAQFYAQSWLTVHYLSRDNDRRRGLINYLAALNAGDNSDASFQKAFGVDYVQFGALLKAYLRSKEFTRTRMTGALAGTSARDPVTALTALPDGVDALVVPAAALATIDFTVARDGPARDAKRDAALLATVRRASAPGDGFAALVAAEAELKLGDRADGLRRLDAIIAATPTDAQALYLRGMAQLVDAQAAADRDAALRRARVWLTRANAARPDDFRILAAYAQSFGTVALPDRAVPVLMRAVDLAPQVAGVAIFAALVQAQRGDKAEARRLLRPIASNPHGGAATTAATALLADIEKGGKPERPVTIEVK